MKNHIISDPFLNILPSLDLHGETKDTIVFLIKDFINYQYKLNNKKIYIIHGRHGTVLKKEVQKILKDIEIVDKYYIYSFNDGITIVELK